MMCLIRNIVFEWIDHWNLGVVIEGRISGDLWILIPIWYFAFVVVIIVTFYIVPGEFDSSHVTMISFYFHEE
ncbi:uncharacterized protein OCT59_006125 [Rhizophagus irregularis]|uniref:uncharacterized protein n=1 Tax=Rhizophagus irregularis TaxID=588596 RepID=UPI0033204E20|nr:hypothetical protein OCT59_006125 [Rhizophagus irregularis]